jgi:von Willebrand factor type A domain/Aerotolerance regulator N-terminal
VSSVLFWALGFGNIPLLYGLAAAGVPVLIHLLNRRRFKEVTWAAMRFLLAAVRQNRRRIRIEQWLLLAIRTLVVILVVMAMAKPFLESFGAVIAGLRTHRVLVLDDSLSMGYTSGETSRFEQAKAVAAQLVKDSRPGDSISVILMGDPPKVVISEPTQNLAVVRKEIEELTLSHGGTNLAATFRKVDEVLEASSISQKQVVFLTDLQAASWRPKADVADELKKLLARVEDRRVRWVVIDLGKTGGENRAVTDLRPGSPFVPVGSSALIRTVLHNFGASPSDGVRVRLTVDGRLGPEESFDLQPGEDVPAVFPFQFSAPGDHLVEVSIDDDPLALDNRRYMVVPVRESLKVLLVDGHFKSEPYQAETDYLAQALSPTEESPGQPRPIRVEVIPESQLANRELADFDVVFLCNVNQFIPRDVTALGDFLNQGGGVVFFGGDQVLADNYNRLLYADGKGILPAEIGPSVGDASQRQGGFLFNALGYRHSIVSEYQGASDPITAGITQVRTWQYHKLVLPKDTRAERVMTFDNGDPAIIELQRNRGTIVLVATSADAGWTDWPLHKSFPPLMQQIAIRASTGRFAERNIRVGQPFDQSFAASGAGSPVTVVTPKGQQVSTKLAPSGGVSQFHFEQTDLAGRYSVRIGPPLSLETSFAANPDPAESDLTKLVDRAALADAVPGWDFLYLTNSRELAEDASSVGRRGELHRFLLYSLLTMLLLESLLAWRFGHHEATS